MSASRLSASESSASEAEAASLVSVLRAWTARHWAAAAVTGIATVLVVGIGTDLIDTPWFSREVPPTWWSYPVLLVSAVLMGLLVGSYVNAPARTDEQKPRRWGGVGGVLTFFAVGCPVCNKLVLLVLGTSGAMQYFQPAQPVLAVASIAALAWALRSRLRNYWSCRVSTPWRTATGPAGDDNIVATQTAADVEAERRANAGRSDDRWP